MTVDEIAEGWRVFLPAYGGIERGRATVLRRFDDFCEVTFDAGGTWTGPISMVRPLPILEWMAEVAE